MYNKTNYPLITSDCNKSGVYLITIGSDTYVGSTTQKFKRRWSIWLRNFANFSNLSSYQLNLLTTLFNKCNIKKSSYEEYIVSLVHFAVLEIVEDMSILYDREQYWINTLNPTMNLQYTSDNISRAKDIPKFADKRILSNRATYLESHIKPIIDTLSKLDPSAHKDGKWKLTCEGRIFRFSKLSSFAEKHGLNRRVLDSISRDRFDYELPITLINTKSRV